MKITVEGQDAKPEPQVARGLALDFIASQPWAIEQSALENMRAIASRSGASAVELRPGKPLQNTRAVSLRGEPGNQVAVIPITGPIFRYANLFTEISGATSLDVLATDFSAALDNPAVKSIVLSIDSPGGMAAGIGDFAEHVRAASKPVVAFVDGLAASGGYWIAAAAKTVVISKSGLAGSVGVVLGIDTTKSEGVVEFISSQSPNKRPDATTDAGRAQLQGLVDSIASVFVADVAAFRGTTPEAVINDFRGGAMLVGADAVAAGMADRVGTLEGLITGLLQGKQPNNQPIGVMRMNLEQLKAEFPALVAELLAESRDSLSAELIASAANAERERIQSVEAQAMPGHEALIAALKFDGKTSGAEAAIQVIRAERAALGDRAGKIMADAIQPIPSAVLGDGDGDATNSSAALSVEERCKILWDKNEKIRTEFTDLAAFTAYERALAKGKVRILKTA